MLDDPNMPGWMPGAPPPWLDAYGPAPSDVPPIDQLATTLGPRGTESTIDPTPPPPPPPVGTPATGTGRKGGTPTRIGEGGPMAQEEIAKQPLAASPAAAPGQPPWLADLQQQFIPPGLQQQAAAPSPNSGQGLPTPDAITGGAQPTGVETPDQALARIAIDPKASLPERQKAWQDMAPEQRTLLVNNADPKELAAIATADMDPRDLATIAVRHQQAQIHDQSAQQLELARQRDEAAARDYATFQATVQQANARTAQLEQDAQNLAQQKIDPNEHGVGHFIASVIAGALGGAVSQYTGGRNLALEELDKQSQRRIEAQQQNIQNGFQAIGVKRNLVAEQFQRSGDMYHAATAYHLSQYDRALADLQTRMQDYDPQGTTNLRAIGVVQQIQAQRAALLQKYNQQQIEDGLKRAQTAKTLAETFKTSAETDTIRLKQAQMGAGPAPVKVLPVEYFTSLGLIAPPAPMSMDAYKAWLELSKSGAETSKAQQDAASSANAGVVSKPHGDFAPITDASGKPIRIAPDVAKELNDQNVGAQNVVSDMNEVKRMLEEDPSFVDRKKWAEIQARVGQSMAAMAEYFKAKFSSREEEAIKDITNLDFDSYVRRLKDKGTAVASIDGIIDTIKTSVDTRNSATLHTPVSGVLSDVGTAPKPQPTEVDRILAQLATPNPTSTDPTKLVELYTTPEERQKMPAASLLTLAQGRAAQNPGPSLADRASLLDRAKVFANATIKQHSGRYYLVDAEGNDIKGVAPVDTAAAGQSLLAKYRDVARAGIAKLSGDAEDKNVRESAGGETLLEEAGEALKDEAP